MSNSNLLTSLMQKVDIDADTFEISDDVYKTAEKNSDIYILQSRNAENSVFYGYKSGNFYQCSELGLLTAIAQKILEKQRYILHYSTEVTDNKVFLQHLHVSNDLKAVIFHLRYTDASYVGTPVNSKSFWIRDSTEYETLLSGSHLGIDINKIPPGIDEKSFVPGPVPIGNVMQAAKKPGDNPNDGRNAGRGR